MEKVRVLVRGDLHAARVTMLVVRVEGEDPLSSDLKGLECVAQEPSC
jgi:hypothetical protein